MVERGRTRTRTITGVLKMAGTDRMEGEKRVSSEDGELSSSPTSTCMSKSGSMALVE